MAKKPKKKVAKKKNVGGRPTKYKSEYGTKAFVKKFVAHCKREDEVVSLCGLTVYIGITEETIQAWKKTKPRFSLSAETIKQISKNQLFNRGLNGEYVASIVKLGLSANHGMHERNETEYGVSDDLADLMKEIGGEGVGLPIKVVG